MDINYGNNIKEFLNLFDYEYWKPFFRKFVILLGNLFVERNIEWKNEKYNIL